MDPRYPVGQFEWPGKVDEGQRRKFAEQVAETPAHVRAAVKGLSDAQLDTPYREGGWTVRQLVHHLADSHLNAYVRFKLALTEENPPVKTYEQQIWAELPDAKTSPIEPSLTLLESLHKRWSLMFQAMKPADFARTFQHPEWGKVSLEQVLAQYAWHGRHHVAHITELRKAKGW